MPDAVPSGSQTRNAAGQMRLGWKLTNRIIGRGASHRLFVCHPEKICNRFMLKIELSGQRLPNNLNYKKRVFFKLNYWLVIK